VTTRFIASFIASFITSFITSFSARFTIGITTSRQPGVHLLCSYAHAIIGERVSNGECATAPLIPALRIIFHQPRTRCFRGKPAL
jgi:hypothetical protein